MPTKPTNSRKGIPAGAVLADALMQLEAYRKTNAWLQTAGTCFRVLLVGGRAKTVAILES